MGLPVQPSVHPAQLCGHSPAHEWGPIRNDRLQWRGVLVLRQGRPFKEVTLEMRPEGLRQAEAG